jgi:hypothetical protein
MAGKKASKSRESDIVGLKYFDRLGVLQIGGNIDAFPRRPEV